MNEQLKPVRTGESALQWLFKYNLPITLLEMKKYYARNIFALQFFSPNLDEILSKCDPGIYFQPDTYILSPVQLTEINLFLEHWERNFKYLEFSFSLDYLPRVRETLNRANATKGDVDAQFKVLDDRIEDELKHLVFGFIPKEKTKYFQNAKLFGDKVYDNFPSARSEIQEAGTCYAHGLNTACVFHLMRALEIAVQAMHWTLTGRKKLTYEKFKKHVGKTHLSKPLELCDWNQLINGLNLALEKLENGKSKSILVSQKHQYYSEVIGIFKTFKDAWRNTISHAHEVHVESKRLLFDSVEAAAIMDHAETFMKKLTEKVIEKI